MPSRSTDEIANVPNWMSSQKPLLQSTRFRTLCGPGHQCWTLTQTQQSDYCYFKKPLKQCRILFFKNQLHSRRVMIFHACQLHVFVWKLVSATMCKCLLGGIDVAPVHYNSTRTFICELSVRDVPL